MRVGVFDSGDLHRDENSKLCTAGRLGESNFVCSEIAIDLTNVENVRPMWHRIKTAALASDHRAAHPTLLSGTSFPQAHASFLATC